MKRVTFDQKRLKEIVYNMRSTDQIPGIQSVWDHGLSVAYHYRLLIADLNKIARDEDVDDSIFIPDALRQNSKFILSKINLQARVMQKYLVYHDMGKPICCSKDEFG